MGTLRGTIVCPNVDAVWVCERDDPSGGRVYGRSGERSVEIPITKVTYRHAGVGVHHYKLVLMSWRFNRYELDGGVVFAIGPAGTTQLDPTKLDADDADQYDGDDDQYDGDDDDQYESDDDDADTTANNPFDLAAPTTCALPVRHGGADIYSYRLVPTMLEKETPETQWYDGETVPRRTRIVTVHIENNPSVVVWNVTTTYALIAAEIIENTKHRVDAMFVKNKPHIDADLNDDTAVDQRGFIRQAALRADFPSFASPGVCMPECAANRIDTTTYDNLVLMTRFATGFDEGRFWTLLGLGPPNQTAAMAIRVLDSAMSDLPPPTGNLLQAIRTLEAFAVVMLGFGGSHYGYNAEKVDDQSVPTIKMGSNSDCEDFAIAAAGLLTWMLSPRGKHLFELDANTTIGRLVAWFCRRAFSRAMVATGFVNLSIARPDFKTLKSDLSGHGWVMLMLADNYRPLTLVTMRYFVVECTAPYTPHGIPPGIAVVDAPIPAAKAREIDGHPDLSADAKEAAKEFFVRQTPTWLLGASKKLYGGAMILVRDDVIDGIPSSLGPAHFMDVDEDGAPFKYRTVATLSDAFNSYAVVPRTDHDAAELVAERAAKLAAQLVAERKAAESGRPVAPVRVRRDRVTHEIDIGPPIAIAKATLDRTSSKAEVSVTMSAFMRHHYSLRRIASTADLALFDRYFRGFMINPLLTATLPMFDRFFNRGNGLRGRRIHGATPIPSAFAPVGLHNQYPPPQQLVLPRSWSRSGSVVPGVPRVACAIVPADEYRRHSAGAFVGGGRRVLYFPMRFMFGDMIAFGLEELPMLVDYDATDDDDDGDGAPAAAAALAPSASGGLWRVEYSRRQHNLESQHFRKLAVGHHRGYRNMAKAVTKV